MRALPTVMIVLALALAPLPATAEELGVVGPTYPIAEQSLLEMIAQRLRAMEANGQLKMLRERAIADGREAVTNPAPVAGLSPTSEPRTFFYDPTYVLGKNIFDATGRVVFPAGMRTNPLSITPMSKRLLFFDARDAAQVRMARMLMDRDGLPIKPVLVGGAYLELMRRWKTRVYYDQQGLLVRRFGIRHVPALVSQDGLRLRIDEVVAP